MRTLITILFLLYLQMAAVNAYTEAQMPEYKKNTHVEKQNILEHKTAEKQYIRRKTTKQNHKKFGPGVTKISDKNKVTNLGVPMARLIISLGLVFGMLIGTLYLLKKFSCKLTGNKSSSGIKVLSRIPLDSKNSLVLIQLYEEELLLGVNQNSISVLKSIASINEESETPEEEECRDKSKKDIAFANRNTTSGFEHAIISEITGKPAGEWIIK